MRSGEFLTGAVAGQFNELCLFNNSSSGEVLYPIAFGVGPSAGCFISGELCNGNLGGTPVNTYMCDPSAPVVSGQLTYTSRAACPGDHLFTFFSNANGQPLAVWPWTWPIARIPPGYTFLLEAETTGVSLRGFLAWVALAD